MQLNFHLFHLIAKEVGNEADMAFFTYAIVYEKSWYRRGIFQSCMRLNYKNVLIIGSIKLNLFDKLRLIEQMRQEPVYREFHQPGEQLLFAALDILAGTDKSACFCGPLQQIPNELKKFRQNYAKDPLPYWEKKSPAFYRIVRGDIGKYETYKTCNHARAELIDAYWKD